MSSGVSSNICATMPPMRASRPWVQRQALGAPDVPDVNNKSPRVSSVTAAPWRSGSGAPATSSSRSR